MNIQSIRIYTAVAAFVAAISVVPVSGWAQGSESDAGPPSFVQHFDQDGDGLVSADEFPGAADQFSQLDLNGDGYLDESEAPRQPPPPGPPVEIMLAELDGDGDGQLSASEFPGPPDQFECLDTDGDGFLNAAELLAGRPEPPLRGGFDRDDTDQDGRVSQAEFSGPADLFNQLDQNGDGYITRDELPSGPPQGVRQTAPQAKVD